MFQKENAEKEKMVESNNALTLVGHTPSSLFNQNKCKHARSDL